MLKRSHHSVLPNHFNDEFAGRRKLSTRQVLSRGQIVLDALSILSLTLKARPTYESAR